MREDFSNSTLPQPFMRRSALALCLIAIMVMAGCLGPSTSDWGTGNNAVEVDFSKTDTSVRSTLSGSATVMEGLQAVGCPPDATDPVVADGAPFLFTGYLATSHFYDSHNPAMGAKGLDYGVTTAVGIQKMTFAEAAAVVDGDGARIDVKEWNVPMMPSTGAGSINLEKVDADSDTDWFVLGLIPTTEHIQSGFTALGEWHQPITIEGYMVSSDVTGVGYYNSNMAYSVESDCSMGVNAQNRENLYVFVTKINFENGVVTQAGNDDEEWIQGNVPFFGRTGYLLFFMVFGIGGGAGSFIFSKQMIRTSARSSMKVLVGSQGLDKIKQVKSDIKSAKKAGMESPEERLKKQRASVKKEKPKPQEETKSDSGDAMGGFDLDSVLASTSAPVSREPQGRKSSVVVTQEAEEMDRSTQSVVSSSNAPSFTQRKSSVVTGTTSVPSSNSPPTRTAEKKPKLRKRKAVTRTTVEEETPHTPAVHEEEEEFSDFSF